MIGSSNLNNAWNNDLKPFLNLVDAVTIHEYSLNPDDLDGYNQLEQIEIISQWGLSRISMHVNYVHTLFGNNIPIWMTEFNYGNSLSNSSDSYDVLHSMFIMSYIVASICDDSNTMEILMLHAHSNQMGIGWANLEGTVHLPGQANDNPNVGASVISQIYAHLSYVGFNK